MEDFNTDNLKTGESGETQLKNFEFNLGLMRLESLAEIIEAISKKYYRAIQNPEEKYVHEYQSLVNTLYTEIFIYMEEKTETEEKGVKQTKKDLLTKKLDDYSEIETEAQARQKIEEIREIYLAARELMLSVGLDIPEKEQIGETDVFS